MFRYLLHSLAYHWRVNTAVALGAAVATAVLTGALLVGDSVRGSLLALSLDRLGKIDEVLVLDRFFRSALVEDLRTVQARQYVQQAVPAILFPQGTIERITDGKTLRASSVLILGADPSFWDLDSRGVRPTSMPREYEVVLNASLANELRANVGDTVTLRFPKMDQVPADSPLASKNNRVRGLPGLKVVDIVPTEGLGQFSMQASQGLPNNAFVSLGTLQAALDLDDRVNAILVSRTEGNGDKDVDLNTFLHPTPEDAGISIARVTRGYRDRDGTETVSIDYFTITTDRMIFSDEVAEVIQRAVPASQPVLTYLANSIALAGETNETSASIPYSMVSGLDPTVDFPLTDVSGAPISAIGDEEIVLNEWSAENLGAEVGDEIRVAYFQPETTHGKAVEESARFRLKAIAGLTEPVRPFRRNRPAEFDQPLTPATDPRLTPEVKGVTDQDTIDDWDAPFPFDYKRVREIDEAYWDNHRTTPKAFISAEAGRRLWGSRFGEVTSFRVPNNLTIEALTGKIQDEISTSSDKLGFSFVPVKKRQIAASAGTTPFDALFLALSFFVIAAALLMVALLFQLGTEQRSFEIGTLLAVGFARKRVGRLFTAEGTLLAAIGAVVGVGMGIVYARLMLAGLTHWWLGAITTPFLTFYATPRSLIIGYVLGVFVCAATIAWTVYRMRGVSVRRLLSGQASEPILRRGGRIAKWISFVALLLAILLAFAATRLGGMAQAGAFVASGALLLTGLLLVIRRRLRSGKTGTESRWTGPLVLWKLAVRSGARNPGRSTITIALMATATFLIVALSSFRLAPTDQGVGGFELLGESSAPLYADLNEPSRRAEYFGSQATKLADTTILGLRLRAGDDASCNNLYRASQPRVLGVPSQFAEYFDESAKISFAWSAAASDGDGPSNPWQLLFTNVVGGNPPVPVVLDQNTAMYSLGLYQGVGEEFDFNYDGQVIRFRVVGLLANSVLQGSLLISETHFERKFPQISGYRFFLIDCPPAQQTAVSQLLEEQFGDQGFDARPSRSVLEQLLAVQNTYLSTFQSLGALGLLLGTFGLATVQLRNVLERRGELALMRAAGYRQRRLAELVLLENVALLAAGLATGIIAAILAVLPHKLMGESAISWTLLRDLGVMLAAVFLAGMISSFLTVRAVLRLPVIASLRAE